MDINLNGAPYQTASACLVELLAEHAIDATKPGIAVAINDSIVPRAQWPRIVLKAGDTVEVVRPHSGG